MEQGFDKKDSKYYLELDLSESCLLQRSKHIINTNMVDSDYKKIGLHAKFTFGYIHCFYMDDSDKIRNKSEMKFVCNFLNLSKWKTKLIIWLVSIGS